MQQTPSCRRVTRPFSRAIRRLLFVPFLPNLTSKIAASPPSSSSSFDSHKRRTHPVESILAWTDRSLLCLSGIPPSHSPQAPVLCLLKFLYCSVFSNSRIGNSLRYWWRHVTLFHRKPLVLIFNWFPYLIGCSVRSMGSSWIARATTRRKLRNITVAMCLVPFPQFHGTWIDACIFPAPW